MEILFENHGLNFIGIKILKNLDPESLMNARLVAKPWKDLIDTTRELSRNRLQIKLEILQRTFPQLFLDYPEWRRILVNFGTDRSEEDIKRLIQLLTDFFRDFFREYGYDYLDPILYSVYISDLSTIRFIAPSINNLNNIKCSGSYNILHHAAWKGKADIVKFILTEHPTFDINEKTNTRSISSTPYEIAKIMGNTEIVQMLENSGKVAC